MQDEVDAAGNESLSTNRLWMKEGISCIVQN
jgi:hypothetical protein